MKFDFKGNEISTITDDKDEPWFVAAEVCRVLWLSNPTVALNALDDDEKAKFDLGLPGSDSNIISESGVYALIMRSRKPEAKTFRKWVMSEVLSGGSAITNRYSE